ncbi:MAG: UDP-N-acetylmuramate:L-alanyl-gamma-D-glutamyl-meso-diaminopimelate ligase [Legionellales bacterium]|nr:UDP-N-acetylmuramate:L-alanyl-gamma-D-glutamyl-meso-diaminopimelate ligase [Legionellales bacterium]
MHIHIMGICGTFMGGIAVLAKQQGFHVTGSDANVYPPMSTQLEEQGIELMEGFKPANLEPRPDMVIIGNAISCGNPEVEAVLDKGLPYTSGPQWLAENLLRDRWVLAVSGTHGKTTTSSMLAWILEYAGLKPGFLIGGVAQNFGISARMGDAPFFVIEADEYDSAFFDKRSKFIHYRPRTLTVNNLEFDHADIFSDLAQIQQQFHYLIRTVPASGLVIAGLDDAIKAVLDKGCWSEVQTTSLDEGTFTVANCDADGSSFDVVCEGESVGRVEWPLLGKHNVSNALNAIAAARHAGVLVKQACDALNQFVNAKRRLEVLGVINGVTVYDDFAHHPTAIASTVEGLRARVGKERIFAVVEFGSYTMKQGVHKESVMAALSAADEIILARPEHDWGLDALAKTSKVPATVHDSVDSIIDTLVTQTHPGDHILIMSNKGFAGIYAKLLQQLTTKAEN